MKYEEVKYTWFGKYFKGAMRDRRAWKRVEAERRNALTPVERTRQYRRDQHG